MALYVGTDSVVQLAGLTDHEGAAVTDATVTATLYRGETEIWSDTLGHVGEGTYEAAVPDTLDMTAGEVVRWRVSAAAGELNAVYEWRERVRTRAA